MLPRVYPILDTRSFDRHALDWVASAAALLEGGAAILQIRHKTPWTRETFARSREIARLCRDAGAQLIVNDRADFALLLEAGLHLGQDDLSPRDARRLLGTSPTLGYSTHNLGQLCAAAAEPVDYVALGPIFQTDSKSNPDPVVGTEQVRRARAAIDKPLVAIGGITIENAAAVWRAGADAVAIIAGLFPEQPTPRSLRLRMEQWRQLEQAV